MKRIFIILVEFASWHTTQHLIQIFHNRSLVDFVKHTLNKLPSSFNIYFLFTILWNPSFLPSHPRQDSFLWKYFFINECGICWCSMQSKAYGLTQHSENSIAYDASFGSHSLLWNFPEILKWKMVSSLMSYSRSYRIFPDICSQYLSIHHIQTISPLVLWRIYFINTNSYNPELANIIHFSSHPLTPW